MYHLWITLHEDNVFYDYLIFLFILNISLLRINVVSKLIDPIIFLANKDWKKTYYKNFYDCISHSLFIHKYIITYKQVWTIIVNGSHS